MLCQSKAGPADPTQHFICVVVYTSSTTNHHTTRLSLFAAFVTDTAVCFWFCRRCCFCRCLWQGCLERRVTSRHIVIDLLQQLCNKLDVTMTRTTFVCLCSTPQKPVSSTPLSVRASTRREVIIHVCKVVKNKKREKIVSHAHTRACGKYTREEGGKRVA